ncbi:MAG: DUF4115 domain-containing protein [Candidatus Thiodiazotropha sp. (ex Epidulcina cf. delphinae)]|nr:DUF4115 domain-containing protein [Candidatus Thiodiazotropha sp. (ex Epidulcina cf. delphinae)]
MNVSSKDENQPSTGSTEGPGSQLRKARKRQGLEQTEMATQLHLSQAMIEALESDNYEKLPKPVFVQGYLRNYSRLLGVNEDAVIEAYQRLLPSTDEKPISKSQDGKLSKGLHSGHGVMRLVTWGILLLLVLMLFFWWQTRVELEEPAPAPAGSQFPQLPQDSPAGQLDLTPLAEEEAVIFSTPVEEAPQAMDSEIEEPAVTAEVESPIPEERFQAPLEIEAPAPVIETAQPREAVTEEVVAPVSKLLVFEFTDACWTDVRDRDGKVRIIGEMRSGIQRTLSSRLGPFNVVLGNAPAVRLTVDGQPFDLQPFIRGKVARFTLDPARL